MLILILDSMAGRLNLQRRLASTLIERIEMLTPRDIDPMTRRPIKPVDDVFFLNDSDSLPTRDALRVIKHDFALYKCLKLVQFSILWSLLCG